MIVLWAVRSSPLLLFGAVCQLSALEHAHTWRNWLEIGLGQLPNSAILLAVG